VAKISRKNPLALMALCVLWQTPAHPYGIVQYLKSTAKDKAARLNYGSLYAVIASLEKAQAIEAVEVTQTGNLPPRTVYRVTDTGVAEMNAWLANLIASPVDEAPQFMAALSILPTLGVDETLELLRHRATVLQQKVDLLISQRAAAAEVVPEAFSVDELYQMAMTRAELAFVTDLVSRIDSGRLDGLDLWRDIHAHLQDGRPDWQQCRTNPSSGWRYRPGQT